MKFMRKTCLILLLSLVYLSTISITCYAEDPVREIDIVKCRVEDPGEFCEALIETYGENGNVKYSLAQTENCKYASSFDSQGGKIDYYLSINPESIACRRVISILQNDVSIFNNGKATVLISCLQIVLSIIGILIIILGIITCIRSFLQKIKQKKLLHSSCKNVKFAQKQQILLILWVVVVCLFLCSLLGIFRTLPTANIDGETKNILMIELIYDHDVLGSAKTWNFQNGTYRYEVDSRKFGTLVFIRFFTQSKAEEFVNILESAPFQCPNYNEPNGLDIEGLCYTATITFDDGTTKEISSCAGYEMFKVWNVIIEHFWD